MKVINDFFNRAINYSACNEDGRSELQVIEKIADPRQFLVIAGGGERVFNLLVVDRPDASVDVVDGNASQLFLFELKKCAITRLSHEDMSGFIGLTPLSAQQRLALYRNEVRPHLSMHAQAYFDSKSRSLAKGILYQGEFEKFLNIIATVCNLAFGNTLKDFFACKSLDEQRIYFRERISGVRWNTLMWLLCRKIWFRLLSRDPAFYTYEGLDSYYRYLTSSIEHSLQNIPARENFLLALMLTGRYLPEYEAVPPCYRRDNLAVVKRNLENCEIRLHHGLLGNFLDSTSQQFDFMSLSDIPSYVSNDELKTLLENISAHLSDRACVVIRQLFSRHEVFTRDDLSGYRLNANKAMESQLRDTDSSFIYQFQVLSRAS